MPFLTERIYKGITEGKDVSKESVHLESWPLGGHIDEIAIVAMDETRKLVSLGLEARNKVNIKVRQPLQALKVKSLSVLTEEYLELIEDEVNVKEIIEDTGISGDVELDTIISKDLQREGSVRELARAIKDLRKDSGLGQGDIATLEIQTDDNGKTFILETSDEIKKTCSLSEIVFTEIQLQQSKEITLEETSYLLCIR